MAEVVIIEAPGATGDLYQCPNCSRSYHSTQVTADGIVTDRPIKPPENCLRCGSPMDVTEAKRYGNEQAAAAGKRDELRTVQRTTRKV